MTHADLASERGQTEKTILVVEDDADIGEFLTLALTMETPYHVRHTSDGFQAIEEIKSQVPDLLVLDYRLPKMNGLELYDRLRAHKKFQHIPVLFISASPPLHEMEKRQVPFLPKPFSTDEFVQVVKTILHENPLRRIV